MAKAPGWPAGKIEHWAVADLLGNPRNARTHPPGQIAQLRSVIRDFGWTVPILVRPDGQVIAGNGRLEAARAEGIDKVPVIVARGWSDQQCRAYAIIDNKVALNSGWDNALLREELESLLKLDLGLLDQLGFSEAELRGLDLGALLGGGGLTDPEAAPALPEHPVVARGELWCLGAHRLLCGDATVAADVGQVLGGAAPHLMVTDPPYGVDYDPDWRNRAPNIGWSRSRSIGTVSNDDHADWREAWALFPGDVVYAWHPPGAKQVDHFNALVAADFEIRMQVIWAKQQFPIGRGNYHVQHEPCWYAVRKGKTAHWQGDRKQSTLWQIDKPVKSETGHSTQKPVECMRRPIENNSARGEAVYDPFMGSGTTIIAAEMTGRVCHGIEINPAYVEVAIERWQSFTGGKATLDGDGRDFATIAAERRGEYRPRDDLAKSIGVALEAVRERKANGGPGWEPKA